LILSFSGLLDKPIASEQDQLKPSKIKNLSCLKGELVLDNLFVNQPEIVSAGGTGDTELNKFNTDFYKLCSDSFLNESTYGLAGGNSVSYHV